MNREPDNPAISIFSFLYPFLSMLAPILYINKYLGKVQLFPEAYLLFYTILIIGAIPVYNAYCRKNLYVFEDLKSAYTERILFSFPAVSTLAALAVFRFDFYKIYLALPFIAVLIQVYLITVFQAVRNSRIGGIIHLSYRHIGSSVQIVIVLVLFKVLLIISLYIWGDTPLSPALSILGFTSDTIVLLFFRREIQELEIQKEGFPLQRKNPQTVRGAVLYVSLFLVSLVTAGNRALFGPEILMRFYHWLQSLSRPESPRVLPPPPPISEYKGMNPDALDSFNRLWNQRKYDLEFLRKFYRILAYILAAFILFFTLYFVFYPLFAPLFHRNRKNPSFRDYYSTIWQGIKRFFASFKSIFFFWRNGENFERSGQGGGIYGSAGLMLPAVQLSSSKKSELRIVYRFYGKLRSRGRKILMGYADISTGAADFFTALSDTDKKLEESCSILSTLYNSSFFSPGTLSRDQLKILKEETVKILKELR